MLTTEQESTLFNEYKLANTSERRKSQIKDQIISSNLRFVFKQAKGLSKSDPGMFEDLIAAGNEGLLVGFDKYDPDSGVKFLTYAGWWVRQRMLNEMAHVRLVKLPIWKQQLSARIQKAKEANEALTIDGLKELFPEVSDKDLKELWDTKFLTFYIDDLDEGEFLIDPISQEVERKIDDETVFCTVRDLPSPHREIIAKLYGFDDGEEQTLASIAKSLRLSKEEVKRLKAEAISMLQAKFRTARDPNRGP